MGARWRRAAGAVRRRPATCILALIAAVAVTACERSANPHSERHIRVSAPDSPVPVVALRAQRLYTEHCSGCHGADGDGNGLEAALLSTRPRDFRLAQFKYRSTPHGSLPTDDDVMRAIAAGPGHGPTPTWRSLSDDERRSLMAHLKTFSPRWAVERPEAPVPIPTTPPFVGTSASVEKGRGLFNLAQCARCHDDRGLGDGLAANGLVDDWGAPAPPANFAAGLRAGDSARDVYRTLSTGLCGTPMASYRDFLSESQRWHVASFVLHLAHSRTRTGP